MALVHNFNYPLAGTQPRYPRGSNRLNNNQAAFWDNRRLQGCNHWRNSLGGVPIPNGHAETCERGYCRHGQLYHDCPTCMAAELQIYGHRRGGGGFLNQMPMHQLGHHGGLRNHHPRMLGMNPYAYDDRMAPGLGGQDYWDDMHADEMFDDDDIFLDDDDDIRSQYSYIRQDPMGPYGHRGYDMYGDDPYGNPLMDDYGDYPRPHDHHHHGMGVFDGARLGGMPKRRRRRGGNYMGRMPLRGERPMYVRSASGESF